MHIRTILAMSLVAAVFCAGPALAQDKPELPSAASRTVSFGQDVHPILEARCIECHSGEKPKAKFSLESRENVLKGSEYGPAVVEGNSADSRLIHVVSGLDPEVIMPPKDPRLTPEEIGVLRAWIDQGLKWDLEQEPQSAWKAPLAPRRPELPAASGDGTPASPVDRILQPYLAAHNVTAPAVITDAQFARRAYLDGIGLLPTPEQLDEFLKDAAPDKRDKLVDRLLSDRQGYAEHWMSFWNDCLRNDFQGTGYIDGGRKPITPWLYQALYDNLPYDQFVAQLINPTAANEGFVNGIVWRGTVSAAETPAMQAARSISQVFLGVNLKCASCHDSFVNEWKLSDAYGMAGVFSAEPLEMVRCDAPTGEMAEMKFLWPELGAIDPSRPIAGRRVQLARLVTSEENGRFARTAVNRIWAKLMGRGLVEPLDDMAKEPWNADLLDWLACDLVDHGYDLKATLRTVMTSQAYGMPSIVSDPKEAPYVFRGPEHRRLSAEQFLDALASLTGAWPAEAQFALPQANANGPGKPVRAWRLNADAMTRAMGRPNREQVTTRRDEQPTTLQALEMANGEMLASLLKRGAENMLPGEPPAPADVVNHLYLHALQRPPSPQEVTIAESMLAPVVTRQGVEDLLWAITLLPEFQYL